MTMASLALLALAAASDAPGVGRDVGQVFPQIVLPALADRKPMALSQFRGRKVLLIEFASW